MKRRTLLASVTGTVAATTIAGCSTISGSGGESTTPGDAGEQETLAMTTAASGDGDTEATSADGGGEDDGGTTADGGASTTAGDDESTATATATSESADVTFRALIESIEKCSKTCRTLTYTVQNRGTDPAPDVAVRIQVFTGGNEIWDKEQSVGTVEARSQRTGITRDIDVGILNGRKIQNNDGEVTIKLTPQAAGVSKTFTFERTLDV